MAKQTFSVGQVLSAAQMTSLQATAMGGGAPVEKTSSYVLVASDAGTVIQMNSSSSTTITVNTALFAAGDSVQIQNIGTGTCTITAGTATVTTAGSLALTQWEGGTLYFTSASAAIFFDIVQSGSTSPLTTKGDLYTRTSSADARLPVGTNGYTLVADSAETTGLKWAAPASGSTFAGALAYRVTTATIAGSTNTAITLTAEQYDTDGYHNNSTNTSRMTIPSGKAGYYQIIANCITANTTSSNDLSIAINGTRYVSLSFTGNGGNEGHSLSIIAYLAVSDYVEMKYYNGSGTALNVYGSADTSDQTTSLAIGFLGA